MNRSAVAVILPALNEINCVEKVVEGFLREGTRVIVVDNGSNDGTGQAAQAAGAEVVYEKILGYGSACLAGLSYLTSHPPQIVVFADCDGTLDTHDIHNLIAPIESGNADLVLGRRARVERGALPLHQKLGNLVACFLLRILYGVVVNDIPPYRAMRWTFITGLDLSERTYGFPIETIALTAKNGGNVEEVNVSYRCRLSGESKVTGSLSASLRAGVKMMIVTIQLRF
ncbi:MAG: glycosyltransferase family 2 protein, partial [Candidatus Bathyarchaeia archaeon]